MKTNLSDIAIELKNIRKRKGLSQKNLAEQSGISRVTLVSIEKGCNLSVDTLLHLLDSLGMELRIIPKTSDRGRVDGRFPNFEEIRKMRLTGEI